MSANPLLLDCGLTLNISYVLCALSFFKRNNGLVIGSQLVDPSCLQSFNYNDFFFLYGY